MDRAKVFKDYFVSSQNKVLLPNEDFGRRKFINVGVNRSLSLNRIEELQQNHSNEMRSSNKQWIHPPDALTRGHIMYTVKFLGECEVECPKGTDIVKDAIRKRKFNKTLRKTEGQKTPKVELVISINGVTIQEPKTKITKHQYPLHRISYCADDKSDKRMLTFIAKSSDTEKHFCYVFASDKNAEEITLTIGQAFDLAYRRFLETQGKDMDTKKQQLLTQKKVETLEKENEVLRLRIRELELLKDRSDIENYKKNNQLSDLTQVSMATAGTVVTLQNNTGESTTESPSQSQHNSPKQSAVGRKLENLVFDTGNRSSPITNGTSHTSLTPGVISPPPPSARSRAGKVTTPVTPSPPSNLQQVPSTDIDEKEELASIFMQPNVGMNSPLQQDHINRNNGFNPFVTPTNMQAPPPNPSDPFGMSSFNPDQSQNQGIVTSQSKNQDIDSQIRSMDKDFLDLQAGFSQGLSFGTEEFGMEDFDPLS